MAERGSYHPIPFGAIFIPDMRSSGLEIRYLMQAFSFNPQKHAVDMLVDVVVANPTDERARFRLVHYGLPEKTRMVRFSPEGHAANRMLNKALHGVYEELVDKIDGGALSLHERVFGIAYKPETFEASLAGPGGCLAGAEEISLENVSSGVVSSYLIPPRDFEAMQPGEVSACRIRFELIGDAYDRMANVEGQMEVDSPTRIAREIYVYDASNLPEKDRALLEGYASHIIPVRDEDVIILPRRKFEAESSLMLCPNLNIEEARKEKAYYFSSSGAYEWHLSLRPKVRMEAEAVVHA